MSLESIIEYFTPYSVLYGTGNVQLDLLIISGLLSIISLLFVVKLTFRQADENSTLLNCLLAPAREIQDVNEVDKSLGRILDKVELLGQYAKQDMGFVTQEVRATKKAVRDVHDLLADDEDIKRPHALIINRAEAHYKKIA